MEETLPDQKCKFGAMKKVAVKLGVSPEAIHCWKRQSEVDSQVVSDLCHPWRNGVWVYHRVWLSGCENTPSIGQGLRDELLIGEVEHIHEQNYSVYGVRKIHAQ